MSEMAFDWASMWSMFTSGNIYGAVISSYTNVLGLWFYLLVLMLGMIMIYIKTKNFGTTTLVGILISSAVIPLLPTQAYFAITVIIALGITIILYRVFH
jgi:predicted branched-subunit amino acid permease